MVINYIKPRELKEATLSMKQAKLQNITNQEYKSKTEAPPFTDANHLVKMVSTANHPWIGPIQ